jgi:DNA-binding NtrC family response regulator
MTSLGSAREAALTAPILVADVDRHAARALATALSQLGLPADHVGSAREVLERALDGGLRLVIADVALADAPGLTLLSRIRAMRPEVGTILTSGEYRPEVELRARQCGVLYYAPKPVAIPIVHAIAARTLGRLEPHAGGGRR